MKKLLVIQITAFIIMSGALSGMFLYTDVYEEVQSGIVSVLCLSCIKLDYNSRKTFTFNTTSNQPHPQFILDNLSKGPIFIAYREDVCEGCDIMEPVIKEIFKVEFEKEDTYYETVTYNETDIVFFHINIDHASKELKDSLTFYDLEDVKGVPMFTLVTFGYDHGFIKPYFVSVYGTLGLDNNEDRKEYLIDIITDGIDLFNQNSAGYNIE